MREPSVKGTLFRTMCELVLDLRRMGRLGDAEMEKALSPEEVDQLDAEISIAAWYPLDPYCRMLELAASTGEDGPMAFAEASGHASAEQVISLGIYSQLDDRTEISWEDRVGRILSSLWGAFFSVGEARWERVDGDAFDVVIDGVAPMTDLLLRRSQGFIECLARRAAGSNHVVVRTDRSDDGDRVVFRGRRSA